MSKCINLCFCNNHADLGNPDGAFIHDLCLFRDDYPRIGNNDITKEELSHKINYLLQVHGVIRIQKEREKIRTFTKRKTRTFTKRKTNKQTNKTTSHTNIYKINTNV